MTASSNRRAVAALAAAVVALMPAAAWGQGEGPVQLLPAPAAGAGPDPVPAPAAKAPRTLSGGTIAVQPLDRVGIDGVGLIDAGSGGLPADLWRGTPAAVAAALVTKLPVAAPSPAMHDLAVRLLTSVAEPPRLTDLRGPELLPARLERLLLLGEAEAAADLAALVPDDGREEPVLRLGLQARLLAPDAPAPEVCETARAGLAAFESPWWQKLDAFCALTAGRSAEAQVSLAMLRETGHRDAPFFWAAERLSGIQPAALGSVPSVGPLVLAMLRRAEASVPPELLGPEAAPWLLAAVAADGPAAPDRLGLAERAAATGALSAEELAALYGGVEFSAEKMAASVGTARAPRERARLAQLAGGQDDPAAVAEAVLGALRGLAGDPLLPAMTRLHADTLAALAPSPELLTRAAPVARALFAAGAVEAAMRWVEAVEGAEGRDAREAADALWPYARVAAAPAGRPVAPAAVDAWRDSQAIGNTDEGKPLLDRRHALVLGVLQALGEPLHPADWLPVLLDATVDAEPAPMPDAAILRALEGAAADGRTGEAVALALVALGDAGPAGVHPEALFRAVGALSAVGLVAEARALALEALAVAGV